MDGPSESEANHDAGPAMVVTEIAPGQYRIGIKPSLLPTPGSLYLADGVVVSPLDSAGFVDVYFAVANPTRDRAMHAVRFRFTRKAVVAYFEINPGFVEKLRDGLAATDLTPAWKPSLSDLREVQIAHYDASLMRVNYYDEISLLDIFFLHPDFVDLTRKGQGTGPMPLMRITMSTAALLVLSEALAAAIVSEAPRDAK